VQIGVIWVRRRHGHAGLIWERIGGLTGD